MGRERINAVTTSFFGRGSIGLLPGELKKRGYRRGLIVTDRFLFEHKAADRVGEQILAAGAEYAVFYLVQPNPTIQVVNDCIQAARALEVRGLFDSIHRIDHFFSLVFILLYCCKA